MMKRCMSDMCRMYGDVKKGFNDSACFLNGLSLKNKSDIDVSLKSEGKEKPLWGYKMSCNKEVKVLPIIGVILGMMLIMTLLCSSEGKEDKE